MDRFVSDTDQLSIETPELVSIEMPIAGIGSRFLAILIDYLIWTAVIVVLALLATVMIPVFGSLGNSSQVWVAGIVILLVFLFHWGYFTLFEAFNHGQTPGKRVAKIAVIHRSGRAISFVESLARNLVRAVDYLPGFYAVGLIVIFISRQHQRLGDMVAGTIVVRDREIETPHWGEMDSRTFTSSEIDDTSPIPAPHLKVVLPATALAKLSATDLGVLEGFFARRLDMDLTTRAAIAQRIADAVRAKAGLEIPPDIGIETFLEAVAFQIRGLARMS